MYNRVLKQILWAGAFLALAFFIVDLAKIYIEFTPDRFKLSISQLSFSLLILMAKAILKSIVIVSPLVAISIILSLVRSIKLCNLNIRVNSIIFLLSSTISISFYFFETMFRKLKLKEILTKDLINEISIKYSILSILIYTIVVSLVLFRINKSKRTFKDQKRGLASLVISLILLSISYLEFSKFHILSKHRFSVLNYIQQIKRFNDIKSPLKIVDYKGEFKKYLDLSEIYEDEKNYLKLLKRKTSLKPQENNVVLVYVDSLSEADLISNIESRLFTFNRALVNYSDPTKSLRYIKLDLPPLVDIKLKTKDSSINTYYSNVFRDYKMVEENNLIRLPETKHFSIFHLKSLNFSDYATLNNMIKEHLDNTIFVFTSSSSVSKSITVSKSNYLDRSTFIAFHIPKTMGAIDFKANKVIGQEDIMTTIYNLALSEKEYLSLGDDILIDSNSNAVNESICVDETGEYIYSKSDEQNENKSSLAVRCISTKHIANFILKQSSIKN